MKTIFATIAFCSLLVSSGNATTDTTRTKKVKATTNQALLTAEEENLFKNNRLNEKSIQPMYTTVEQFIFTEQIKNVRKEY